MNLNIRHSISSREMKQMDTKQLRDNFLIQDLFQVDQINLEYLHDDRIIVGGVVPKTKNLELILSNESGTQFLLERRELGIINIGGPGQVEFDQGTEILEHEDGLYLPVGNKKIVFSSKESNNPAKFYLFCTMGLISYPVVKVNMKNARPVAMGDDSQSNKRIIYQYFHPNVCKTNTLLMGLTKLEPNNMWNTMPTHTHDRRTECYLYLDIHEDETVFHFMGKPQETRHLVLKSEDFVLSPPWSIHSGVGTKNYSFIWGMGGENIDYTDMDFIKKSELK